LVKEKQQLGGGGGKGGEMTQTMYAHMNKQIKKKRKTTGYLQFQKYFPTNCC
jgi:hypothetical protein